MCAAGPLPGPSTDAPSFTAERVLYFIQQPDRANRARLWIRGPNVREEQLGGRELAGPRLVFISRGDDPETWLLSPQTRKATRVAADETRAGSIEEPNRGGLLSQAPCEGYPTKRSGFPQIYEGLTVEQWFCSNEGSHSAEATQLFSPGISRVIKEETAAGFVSVLHNIRLESLSDEQFRLPSDYQVVSPAEFFLGAKPLSRYHENSGSDPVIAQ